MGKSNPMESTSEEGPNVLVLTAGHGGGYERSARAIIDALKSVNPGCTTHLVDYVERFMTPTTGAMAIRAYRSSGFSKPLTKPSDAKDRSFFLNPGIFLRDVFEWPGRGRFVEYVKNLNPDVIVSNFAVPAESVAVLKRQGTFAMPCAVVVSEFVLVSGWIQSGTDLYCVASEQSIAELEAAGVPPFRTVLSGIPVPRVYLQKHDRPEAARKFHLDPDEPVVVITSDAIKNKWMAIYVNDVFKGIEGRFTVLYAVVPGKTTHEDIGSVVEKQERYRGVVVELDELDEVMDAADLLVTDGGAVVATEALVKELPIISFKPSGVAEIANSDFLQKAGFGSIAWDAGDLMRLVISRLSQRILIDRAKQAAGELKRPDAARVVAERVLELAERKSGRGPRGA